MESLMPSPVHVRGIYILDMSMQKRLRDLAIYDITPEGIGVLHLMPNSHDEI